MKRYLLSVMLCVAACVSAWGEEYAVGNSKITIEGTTATVNSVAKDDLTNANFSSELTEALKSVTSIVFTSGSYVGGASLTKLGNAASSVTSLKLSGATLETSRTFMVQEFPNLETLLMENVTVQTGGIEFKGLPKLKSVLLTPTAYTSLAINGNMGVSSAGIVMNSNVGNSSTWKWTGSFASFDTDDMMDFSQNTSKTATGKNKLTVTGTLSTDDTSGFTKLISEYGSEIRLLDMHDVNLDGKVEDYVFDFGENTNLVTVVLPRGLPDAKKDWFDECGNLHAAITYDAAFPTALRAYVCLEGSLKNSIWDLMRGGNFELGTCWGGYGSLTGFNLKSGIVKVKLSGNLNAVDIDNDDIDYIDGDGHLAFSTEEVAEEYPNTKNLTYSGGHEQCGALKGISPTELDLSDAYFSHYRDMTISAYAYTTVKKLVLPTDSRMNTIPPYMLNAPFSAMQEICIPSNYEYIKVGAFYLSGGACIKHVWTTGHDNDPTTSTIYDNGAVYGYEEVTSGSFKTFKATEEGTGWTPDDKTIQWGTFTLSSNLKEIESYAFGTSNYVKDVYVLALEAPKCHVDAFSAAMYYGNNGFNPQIIDGIITRDSYLAGDLRWITMLHYPREAVTPNTQRYMDQTRKYTIATSMKDGKGGTIYFPSHSEFGRSYIQGTTGFLWNAWVSERQGGTEFVSDGQLGSTPQGWNKDNQNLANGMYNKNNDESKIGQTFYKTYSGEDGYTALTPAPSDYWTSTWNEGDGAKILYPKDEDYRGWHQFVLGATATNSDAPFTPYRSYITDNDWWTICSLIDMTKSEVNILFGGGSTANPVHVCKLVSVTRNIEGGKITLNFSNNLMSYKETVAEGKVHGTIGTTKNEVGDDDIVIHKGVPYMIRPNIPAGGARQFDIYSEDKGASSTSTRKVVVNKNLYDKLVAAANLSGSEMATMIYNGEYQVPGLIVNNPATGGEAVKDDNKATILGGDGTVFDLTIGDDVKVSNTFSYTFVGSYYNSLMPKFSYFLGWDKANNRAAFWYNSVPDVNNFTWANETGIICPVWGTVGSEGKTITAADKDNPAQWKITDLVNDDLPGSSGAKSMSLMSFDTSYDMQEGDGTITKITYLDEKVAPQNVNVYNVNGQFVSTSVNGLAKGIYIVNGKKFVVK